MGFDNSPLLAKISESATRNSAFSCVLPSRKIDFLSQVEQSPSSEDNNVQNNAASEDTASRKRSHNLEENQNQLNENANEIHPTANKKSKIDNDFLPNLHENSINFDYKKLMVDQSNLVKNMAAAFGQLAPNLLENIKINCKSQVEEEVSQSEEPESDKINQQINLNDNKDHVEIV